MSDRTVIIGPAQSGALDAFESIVNTPPLLHHLPPIPVEKIVYSTLFQCGADNVELSSLDRKLSDALPTRWRAKPFDATAYDNVSRDVQALIASAIPDYLARKIEHREVWSIEAFLVDLLYAVRTRGALVTFLEPPTREDCNAVLPPEVGIPIANLLDCFEV